MMYQGFWKFYLADKDGCIDLKNPFCVNAWDYDFLHACELFYQQNFDFEIVVIRLAEDEV